MKLHISAVAFLLVNSVDALANPADKCSNVLIPSTTNVTYNAVTDFAKVRGTKPVRSSVLVLYFMAFLLGEATTPTTKMRNRKRNH
jgi:hypothetical protein